MKATGARKARELETLERKARALDALERSMGIITKATKAAGVPRSTFYNWQDNDEAFKAKVEEVTETQVDFVESQLLTKIREGDTTAIIFYLKTKGRKRGYGEVTADTAIINVNVVEV